MTEAAGAGARDAFARHLLGLFTGAAITQMISLGARTGLFAAAASGPATSADLAQRAGLNERYVREWLGAMVSARIIDYDADSSTYWLDAARAELLTGDGSRNVAPMSHMVVSFGQHLPALAECFRDGGGVPYSAFRPDFTERMDDSWRRIYDEQLIDGFLGRVDGLHQKLSGGIRVADIGCGTGHAVNVMARAFPASAFVGYDIADDAIAAARREAQAMGLDNAHFETLDLQHMPDEPRFDLITAFDVIHDQAQPAAVLRGVRGALADDGIFFVVDFKFSSHLEANRDDPFAALYYSISTMHCMTVSLADNGAGLGTVWGLELAQAMLRDAGFTNVAYLDSPRPQNCILVCRP